MNFTFITLFPSLINGYFQDSILKNAINNNIININILNPRNFSKNKYKKVDDYKIGGGAGLLMSPEPLFLSLKYLQEQYKDIYIIFLTPVGKTFIQNDAKRLSKKKHIVFVCGRYEGIDERIIEEFANEVLSIGDFVLTGGELASLCLCDAISRNIKNVLGNEESLKEESFENELLEAPAWTKPKIFQKNSVVSDFLKGNHGRINVLKKNMSICKTKFFKPDLYLNYKAKNK